MGKCIYYIKLALLSDIHKLSSADLEKVVTMAQFCSVIYARHWFQCGSGTRAATNDLRMIKLLEAYEDYSGENNLVAVLKRHLWYLTESLVPLALCNEDLEDDEREAIANKLFLVSRPPVISPGKPKFPVIPAAGVKISDLIGENSWLIFNQLKVKNCEWMKNAEYHFVYKLP